MKQRTGGKVVGDAPCPSCRAQGRDKTGNHLMLFEDGGGYCNRCGYSTNKHEESMADKREVGIKLNAIPHYPYNNIIDRKINKSVCEFYGVRTGINEATGEVDRHFYPYTSDGQVVGYKVRTLPKSFTVVGSTKDCELFGQSNYTKGGKRLVITGGEIDAMSAFQMLKRYLDTRHKGKGYIPTVVSLPNGESTSGIRDNFEWIDSFEEIIICTDMDEVGRNAASDIAMTLARQNVKIMELPEKDASEMLKAGKQDEFVSCFYDAEEFVPEGFTRVSVDDLMVPKPEGLYLPYPALNQKIHGIRRGEIVLLTAGSGVGKSTLAREIGLNLMTEHGQRVGNVYLEETQVDTVRSYIAMRNDISPMRLAMHPDTFPVEKWQEEADFFNDRGVYLNHFGSLSDEALMQKLRYMVKVRGCNYVILDHISMVVSGRRSGSEGERRDIDMLMTKLASFVVDHNVGVIVISHLSRGKDNNWNAGDIPDLRDLRGSAALEQLSWVILAAARDQRGETPDVATIHVLKNRPWGFVGDADAVQYQHATGRLLPLVEEF